jgi:hypothetical protein
MNTKERLLQEIEQAPDSLIEETLNFLLSAQASYAKSESNVGEAILKLLEEIPLDNDDLEKLPIDILLINMIIIFMEFPNPKQSQTKSF